jgi:hypothetical protein
MTHHTTICEFCQQEYSSRPGSFKKHQTSCKKLYDSKELIFKMYDAGRSAENLSKDYAVTSSTMRRFFRENNREVLVSRNKVNHNFFKQENAEKYWLLGLISADGNVKSKYAWNLSQSNDHGRTLIEHVASIIGHTNKIGEYKTSGSNVHTISISSEEMVKDLSNHGIKERKSLTIKFPDIPKLEYLKSYIIGYVDGDGSIGVYDNGKGSKYISISFVGNKEFMDKCVSCIPFRPSSYNKIDNVYEARWTGEKAVIFGDWLYSSPPRYKHTKYKIFYNYINKYTDCKWSKYNKIYFELGNRLFEESPMSLCKEFDLPFQTLYKWKENLKNVKIIGQYYCNLLS